MKVAIQSTGFDRENLSGPWIALLNLCRALLRLPHNHEIAFFHHEKYDREIYGSAEDWVVPKIPIVMARQLKKRGADIVVVNGIPASLGSALLHRYPGIKTLTYVHGTLPWVPDYAYGTVLQDQSSRSRREWAKFIMRRTAPSFDRVVANSEFTKRVVTQEMGVQDQCCHVVKYGLNHDVFFESKENNLDNYDLGKNNYIVFVANNIQRKNPRAVFESFSIVKEWGYEGKLAVVGGGWSLDDVRSHVDGEVLSDVVLTGFVREEEVSRLYRNAQLSVFPTLHETFGMPLVESMACGCPVVSSNCTVVPEVVGDAALLADDPLDSEEVARLMWSLIADEELRRQMVENGVRRAEKFRWENSARKIIEVFESLSK